jgi:uncharacterized protein (TIGR03437 family)
MQTIFTRSWPIAFLLVVSRIGDAQSLLGTNLIVNPGAETGPASSALTTVVTSIPGWTVAGSANVLSYGITGLLLPSNPAPPDHGFQYFVSGPSNLGLTSTLTQDIDVSAAASSISTGNVKFTLGAFLGSAKGTGLAAPAQVTAAFKNAGGQVFSTVMIGPLGYPSDNGMSLQQQTGLVPSGTSKITVTLTLMTHCLNAAQCSYGAADSLSLVLNMAGTPAAPVLGTNLIANSGAEAGSSAVGSTVVPYIPGWSTADGVSVAPYGGTGWIAATDSGPADRGINLFHGEFQGAAAYQDIDLTAAAALIDAGQVSYEVSAWLGGLAGVASPSLTCTFFDWSGKQLAAAVTLSPATHAGTGLVETYHSDALPAGTRRVHVVLTFPSASAAADNITFVLATPTGPPVITPGGIVSAGAFGGFTAAAPGSWIEIYGANLAPATQGWSSTDFVNGVGPTSLNGVRVSVRGKPAFTDYVSAGQVNALVPSDAPTGLVEITLTNANGTSDGFGIYLNGTQPGLLAPASFVVGGKQYVAALFSDGQTFALPQNAIAGVPSRPAKPGETLTIYGVGFGPVSGGFTAGTIVTAQNSLTLPLQFLFSTTSATVSYGGLAPSYTGLYQFNVVVPNVTPNAAFPISISLGENKGTQTLYIAVGN